MTEPENTPTPGTHVFDVMLTDGRAISITAVDWFGSGDDSHFVFHNGAPASKPQSSEIVAVFATGYVIGIIQRDTQPAPVASPSSWLPSGPGGRSWGTPGFGGGS